MTIGIDITFLKDQYSRRGIGTYGKQLIGLLLTHLEYEFVLFGFDDLESNLKLLGLRKQPNIRFIKLGKSRPSNPLNPLYYQLRYKNKILKQNLDLYFAPHFERGLPVGKVKTAVMMHDVIPFVTGKYSSRGGSVNFIKGRFYKNNLNAARKADLILTNSDFSKRELISKAGFTEQKIIRIYLGIKDSFRSDNINQDTREIRRILLLYKVSKPYILYYGGLEPNKNVISLLHSYKNVLKRFPDLKLVIVGKEFKLGWDNKVQPLTSQAKELFNLSEDLKLKHSLIFTGEVDDEHLPLILNNAQAFVHLSEYEGFGFAVLEAMAAKVPVIAARRSCYPEILKEAALLVDPKNIETISEGILKVLEDEKYAKTLIKEGTKLAETYTWDKTVKATLNAFNNLMNTVPEHHIGYLITNFYPKTGGAEQNCLNLALLEAQSGNQVTVFTSNSRDKRLTKNEDYQGIKINRYAKINSSYYLSFYPSLFWPLLRSNLDVLHVHGFGFIWHDFILIIKKIFNPKLQIINTPHGPFMAHGKYSIFKKILKGVFTRIQKFYLNFLYTKVIAVNPLQDKWLQKEYGIKKEKIVFVPNAIPDDYQKFKLDKKIIEEFKLENKFIISFVGRFEKYKGVDDLFQAVIELKKTHKNLLCIAMGAPGEHLKELETIVKEAKADKYIMILPDPADTTLKTILNLSKIFVMPSSWEAFGISIVEAMVFGNAIVSSRTEGGEYLIKDEENGYLYDHGDVVDLTSRLHTLISNKNLLVTIQENNKIKAGAFKMSNVYLKYKEVIREILK